jgi:hypothetical protein
MTTIFRYKLALIGIGSCLWLFLMAGEASAAPCTFGTNCYCDKVVPAAGVFFDPLLLVCEDFEAPTMRQNTGYGVTTASTRGSGGTAAYGPWYDETGWGGAPNRGYNSYWNHLYGNGLSNAIWAGGQPTSPTLGVVCGEALCHGMKTWEAANLWTANAYTPVMGIYTQDSDFTAEVGTLTVPTNTADGGNGIFDGNASLTHRVAVGSTGSILGDKFWTATKHIGITYAVALPTNLHTSRITESAWKWNEWSGNGGAIRDAISGFGEAGPNDSFPFYGYFLVSGSCPSAIAGAVTTSGTINCTFDNVYVQYHGTASYVQSTDWPLGTWACIRADLDFTTMSNGRIRQWIQKPGTSTETLITDISGINFNQLSFGTAGGVDGITWNNYANANQGLGEPPTIQVTFRYEDNVHIRSGVPVSCAQIGFTGGVASSSVLAGGLRGSGGMRIQ